MASQDETIRRVAEEGLAARNLLNFISDGSVDEVKTLKKPPTSPRPQSTSPRPGTLELQKRPDAKILLRGSKRRGTLSRPKSRIRSASAGRNPEKDLRVRYWTFLFENLHRAVDEIYQTCEMDESVVESKEAIMMLENYSKDFHALIQYININKNYEEATPLNRPTSLAWEVRKSSPGKSLLKNVFIEKLAANSNVKRVLCFDAPSGLSSAKEDKQITSDSAVKISSQDVTETIENESVSTTTLLQSSEAYKHQCDVIVPVIAMPVDETCDCNETVVVNEVLCQQNSIVPSNSRIMDDSKRQQNMSDNSQLVLDSKINEEAMAAESNDNAVECGILTEDVSAELPSICESEDTSLSSNSLCLESSTPASLQSDSSIQQILPDKVASISQPVLEIKREDVMDKSPEMNCTIPTETSEPKTEKKAGLKKRTTINKNGKMPVSAAITKTTQSISSDSKTSYKSGASSLDTIVKTSIFKVSKEKVAADTVAKVKVKDSKDGHISSDVNSKVSSLKDPKENLRNQITLDSKVTGTKELLEIPVCTELNTKGSNLKDSKDNHRGVTMKSSTSLKTSPSKSMASLVKSGLSDISQKSSNITPAAKSLTTKPILVRKTSGNASIEEKKILRPNNTESAIKRNISYVQSLSSRNHLERADNNVPKKMPSSRGLARSNKLSQKSGSMSSLHKTPGNRTWARKTSSVEKIPEILKSTDDESDGWETVRGRNRCRNSPAKKIPFMNKNQESQVAHLAKLNQSRIGGFPYTTKVNGRIVSKNSPKNQELPKKNSNIGEKDASNKAGKSEPVSSCNVSKTGNLKEGSVTKENYVQGSKGEENKNSLYENSSEFYQLKYKNSDEKTCRRDLLQLPLDVISALEDSSVFSSLKFKHTARSSSAPCSRSAHEAVSYGGLSKNLCISDQSLGSQKYININLFKKKLSEKGMSSTKRRVKKARVLDDQSLERSAISQDESDNGLTSDDQDGQLSHDEAFDVQCQELYDTAWKYKILEQQVHKLELSWGEQMDRFDMELRTPGRALEMHEKLSSPFRKKSLFESIRVCNEKQLKAQEQREKVLEEKAQRFKIIQRKRQEMKTLLEQRQEKQRVLMEQKLQRAEEKRKKQLQLIIRKAHDEEEKVNEIAFINTLEAQNKRHDLISKEKDHEARLQDIQEERQRRQEEKAAKEAAAEGRRKILEAERQARLNEMQEKRKIRDHKVEQLFLVKEKERQELASQKARDRELRISALNAQQQITIEELQKKIQLKQEESARRHEENMEQIRQKAFELSIRRCSSNNDDVPQPVPYETKKICSICNVLIGSEVYLLSHLHGKKHQEAVKAQYQDKDPSAEELELYNLKHIVNASTDQLDPNIALDKERQKALKKRCKKLRQRMSNRGQEYESQLVKTAECMNLNMKTKMEKIIGDLKKLSSAVEDGPYDSNVLPALERLLNDVFSIYQKKLHQDKMAFQTIGGVTALCNVFNIISNLSLENNTFMFKKILNHLSNITESVIENSYEMCKFILFSNKIGNLLDILIRRLSDLIPDNISQLMINQGNTNGINVPLDLIAGKLMHLLTGVLTILSSKPVFSNKDKIDVKDSKAEDLNLRVQDMISYIVSIGIVDKLSQLFNCIQGPISNEVEAAPFLLDSMAFMTHLIKLNSESCNSSSNRKFEDSTQLIATLRVTNMVGSVSLLYGLLLHNGAESRSEGPPPVLPKQIEKLAFSTLCMLNQMAVMSLQAFQSTLGSEGLSLQLRHITSYLLWYCNHATSEDLLHEVILLVGYFTVLNSENQLVIQAGHRPTVLQQLCCLPFLYFSDLELTDILFPTLIACCYNNSANKTILQQEMTSELLSNYIEVKYLNIEESNLKDQKTSVHNKRWLFSLRFPKCHWSPAKHYFSS